MTPFNLFKFVKTSNFQRIPCCCTFFQFEMKLSKRKISNKLPPQQLQIVSKSSLKTSLMHYEGHCNLANCISALNRSD